MLDTFTILSLGKWPWTHIITQCYLMATLVVIATGLAYQFSGFLQLHLTLAEPT